MHAGVKDEHWRRRTHRKWVNKSLEYLLDSSATAKNDAPIDLEPTSLKRVQAFGWLKQQALLRERKLNPKGTPVKQRLFRRDDRKSPKLPQLEK